MTVYIYQDMNFDRLELFHSLLLLEEAEVGDYVIVHAGFALHKIDEAVALESLDILRQALALVEKDP